MVVLELTLSNEESSRAVQVVLGFGIVLTIFGLLVLGYEAWGWLVQGEWRSIPISRMLVEFTTWEPESLSSSPWDRFFFWFLDLPLYWILLVSGTAMTILGMRLLS
jgi:hypothetical protein